ncbi:porin [Rhodoferax sp.]|uniref:porin n=1 Tax=Rhodoferax sp. TaxID=50421 RepID=UPI002610DB10|nr:porin [Rhodoferax sp.]MDD3937595.1 porin [Rhodoferax sp.]
MKKTLISLAVLAASGAAMAQSSVTLYGVADVWLGSSKVEVGGVGIRQAVVDTSGVSGSRWGLKGAEDLGGGMKAIFTLEGGISLDTGASGQGGLLFGRQAFVGIQSGLGTVSLGRQYGAYEELHAAVDHNYAAFTFESNVGVAANGIPDYTVRINNSVAYTSPVFNGFSGKVLYGFGENKDTPLVGNSSTDIASLHLKYANGPLLVGYAYQEETQALGDKNTYNLFGGTYNFGVAKIVGSYHQIKNNTTKDREYQVGVVVPFGAAAISAGYTHSESEVGSVSNTGQGAAILATYDLSKRTTLYAGALNMKAHVLNAANLTETTKYGVGIRNSF